MGLKNTSRDQGFEKRTTGHSNDVFKKVTEAKETAERQTHSYRVKFDLLLLQSIKYFFVIGIKFGELILYRRWVHQLMIYVMY